MNCIALRWLAPATLASGGHPSTYATSAFAKQNLRPMDSSDREILV